IVNNIAVDRVCPVSGVLVQARKTRRGDFVLGDTFKPAPLDRQRPFRLDDKRRLGKARLRQKTNRCQRHNASCAKMTQSTIILGYEKLHPKTFHEFYRVERYSTNCICL